MRDKSVSVNCTHTLHDDSSSEKALTSCLKDRNCHHTVAEACVMPHSITTHGPSLATLSPSGCIGDS